MPLKTLFLNPPSFENFDGGASSRWPATREIESYWYPVWLTYPAGLAGGLAPARCSSAPRLRRGDHQDLQGLRVPGALHLDRWLGGRSAPGRGHQGGQSLHPHRLRRPAGDHRPGPRPERVLRAGLHLPPRVRLLGGRVCPGQAAQRDSRHQLQAGRQDRPQPRPPAGGRPGRHALGHQDLQARSWT